MHWGCANSVTSTGPPNPFSQSIWEDDTDGPPQIPPLSELGVESGVTGSRARRLQDLFRPPYELISNASFEDAREEGKAEKKWLLINLQDMSDFTCQSLNRDHWKDESIRALIREHFIFLQYDKDRLHSRQYTHLYFTNHEHENPDNYPHVAIVDPRTGEQVKVWSGRPFPSPAELHADLLEFLDRYSLESFSKNPVVRSRPRNVPVNVDRLSEEEQLRLAVEASLAGVDGGAGGSGAGSSGASSSRNVYDPDAFTRSPTEMRHGGRARTGHIVDLTGELEDSGPVTPAADDALTAHGALPAPPQPAEPAAAPSPFAAIPSDRPHTEPSSDPATTTRIQFRHPNGRVIRRFKLDDPVRRIYEWLKAEPLEGKEGVEFELKTSPQGTDLIESLDKTIAEAGLKQGTVMIEFL